MRADSFVNPIMERASNFDERTSKFPSFANNYAHGSALKGEAIQASRGIPEYIPADIQSLCGKIIANYQSAISLERENLPDLNLYPEARRSLSKSEETKGKSANIFHHLDQLKAEIYTDEQVLLYSVESKRLEIKSKKISQDLTRALADVSKFVFHSKIGDYIAILHQELKTQTAFMEFRFKDYKYVSDLVDQIEKELAGETKETPIADSLEKAAKFTNLFPFKDVGALIQLLRVYADRNQNFHSDVKRLYIEGDLSGLANAMLRDMNELSSFDFSDRYRETFRSCLRDMGNLFYRNFSWQSGRWELNLRGGELCQKIRSQTSTLSRPVTPVEQRLARKVKHEREKSLREHDVEFHAANVRADFRHVLQIIGDVKSRHDGTTAIEKDLEIVATLVNELSSHNDRLTEKHKLLDEDYQKSLQKNLELERGLVSRTKDYNWEKARRLREEENVERVKRGLDSLPDGIVEDLGGLFLDGQ